MTRAIPSALRAHLDRPDTTTCRLLKITARNGVVFGLSGLDINVAYDDGTDDIVYYASRGFDASAFRTESGGSIDNAEATALLQTADISSEEIPGIDLEMVEAGEFDDAAWVCYLVNYEDTSMGHVELGFGDVGQVKTLYGMLWIPELLSIMDRLKQPIGENWSVRCRAVFGSPAGSPTGCGVDADALWTSGSVVSAGAEFNRVFTGDAVASPYSFPGRVEFLTGSNAGRIYATENATGMVVTLALATPYPIEAGDTYRIRPDCGKRFLEDCIGVWANGPNFKGEPHIPVGDSVAVVTPQAQTPAGPRFRAAN